MKQSVIERLYSIFVVLAFGLLFFANAEALEAPNGAVYNLGIGKAFYVPCGLALLSSFFLPKKRDKLDGTLLVLILVAIFSSLLHPPLSETFLSWEVTRFIFAILCFKDIRNIDPLMFAKHVAIASALSAVRSILLWTISVWRFLRRPEFPRACPEYHHFALLYHFSPSKGSAYPYSLCRVHCRSDSSYYVRHVSGRDSGLGGSTDSNTCQYIQEK